MIGSIFVLETQWLGVLFGVFMVIGGWEWSRFIGFTKPASRAIYSAIVAIGVFAVGFAANQTEFVALFLIVMACAWWFVGALMVFRFRGANGLAAGDRVHGFIAGLLVLLATWVALTYIHASSEKGPYLLLFLLMLIWGADVGAYFAGRKFGQRKLAPNVSPGKTIEGVYGGIALSALVAVVGMFLFSIPLMDALWFIPLCFIVVIFSVLGDLLESLFKRRVGVKDSGTIFPGHGGVMDRIDSLTAAAPVFALGLSLFGGVK
ncbi:phosphatidate cytidylyltransferase [Pseudomonadota bacterium]